MFSPAWGFEHPPFSGYNQKLDSCSEIFEIATTFWRNILGGIAQLGERLHGMQEVSGSIPLTSTKNC